MLDNEFLRSLGIREELLPAPPGPQAGEMEGSLPPALPSAGPCGLPAELLDLSEAELEELLTEKHTQENPYVYLMPNGIHQAAVYPDQPRGEYEVEWSAREFIKLAALARDPDINGMLAYNSRHMPWHSVDPNPSQEVKDSLLWLDHDDCSARTTQTERRRQ